MSCQRCQELEAELAYLRDETGIAVEEAALAALRAVYPLEPRTARIVVRLARSPGGLTPSWALSELLTRGEDASENGLRAQISRARRVLGKGAIKSVYGVGYQIAPEWRERIKAAMAHEAQARAA